MEKDRTARKLYTFGSLGLLVLVVLYTSFFRENPVLEQISLVSDTGENVENPVSDIDTPSPGELVGDISNIGELTETPMNYNLPIIKSSKPKTLWLLHITKTGGTTLEFMARDQGIGWGYLNKEITSWKHLRCGQRRTWHTPLWTFSGGNPYDDHPLFVVVRNPFTRMISEYNFYGDGYRGPHPERPATLNRWVQRKIKYMMRKRNPNWCYGLHRGGHYIPQYLYVFDPRTHERLVEHVVRFEYLVDDFNKLMEAYDLPLHLEKQMKRKQLPMKGDRKLLKPSDFDETTRRMICDFYGKDFDIFGYSKELCP